MAFGTVAISSFWFQIAEMFSEICRIVISANIAFITESPVSARVVGQIDTSAYIYNV